MPRRASSAPKVIAPNTASIHGAPKKWATTPAAMAETRLPAWLAASLLPICCLNFTDFASPSVIAPIVAASSAPVTPVTTCEAISIGADKVVKAAALAARIASAANNVIARLASERSTHAPATGVMATAARPPAVMV